MVVSRQFAYFCGVGGIGFLVEAVALQTMLWFGFGPIVARLVGFPLAALTTWLLHRRFTFAAQKSTRRASELSRYFSTQIFSALLGFAAYTLLVLRVPLFFEWPLAALVVSATISMVSNFLLSRFVVFTETDNLNHEKP